MLCWISTKLIFISFSFLTFWTSGLVLSHSFAEYAVVSTLIDYLTRNLQTEDLPKAVAIINLQDGVKTVWAVVLANVADSCMGRFKVVLYTTLAYILVSPYMIEFTVRGILNLASMKFEKKSRSNLLFSKTTPSHNLYDPYYSSWGVIINSDKIFFFLN